MNPPVTAATRILLLEDNPADAELIRRELGKLSFPIEMRWVVTPVEYAQALREFAPELILSDHSVPAFSGRAALELARELTPGIPLILVTASLNEESAVEYMRAGAADYVIKDRLLRLAPAVQSALESARSIRESEDRYRSLFLGMPVGLFRTGLNGEVLAANPALVTLFGYDSAEAMTDAGVMNSYVDAEDRERWRDLLETKGSVEGFEMRLRRHDGGEIWVRESARAVRDPSGAVEYYEGMIEDVTQRKSLEEQFRQAQKMEGVGQLAGGIAHDFNNLLTVISSYADMLAQSFPEGDERVEDATAISNAAARSAELTRQLLAFSRQQVLQPRVLDLNEVIADVQKILGRLLREDIEIATVFAPTLGAILADPGQVEQVIVNLAVNARDAMPKGGTLTITTANVELDATYADAQRTMEPGLYTVLTMTDTGIGMEADVRRRIFEPFYTTKELGKGTGLGLATVYGIVKQSNGYVWVDSEPGRGATFTVYLPQVQGGAEPIAPSSATATAAVGGHETILLVEDEEGVRKLTLKVLQRLGYTVLTATNGEEALNVLEQRGASIDLVITDVIMPKLAGHDLAERLSQRYPRCRVLFMSGYAPDAIGRHRVLDKRTAFLPKPFSPTGLGQKVREVLDAARIVD